MASQQIPQRAAEVPLTAVPDHSTAALVLGELRRRYHKLLLRNLNYSRLLVFISFITLLLGVLFLQRSSNTSYQVHSTLAAGLIPEGRISSVDDVYGWLNGLLTNVWKDPICGNGVCESPFEHAQYGRFGCRADCGRLEDIQNLTAIQIDLYYDFSHPAGSIPATELQNQASWNLCPAGDSNGCYWQEDHTFDQLTGTFTVVVPDVPDGDWAVVVKRDIFDKVAGAVRDVPLLAQQAQAVKVIIAVDAAMAQHASERQALEQVLELGSVGVRTLVNNTLVQQHDSNVADATAQLQNGTLDAASYKAELETLQQQLEGDLLDLAAAADSCPELAFFQPDSAAAPAPPELCERFGNLSLSAEIEQLDTLRSLVAARLAPAGAAAAAALTAGMSQLQVQAPELYAIVIASKGQNASIPAAATPATLADFYAQPAASPALAALASRLLGTEEMTTAELVVRAVARIQELDDTDALVKAFQEVQLALNITRAGCELPYTFVSWEGGSEAHTTCSLSSRTPQYVGSCVAAVPCSNGTTMDTNGEVQVVYACISDDPQLSSSDLCGDVCDTQNICGALCSCAPSCGTGQVCKCDACIKVGSARSDPDFQSMKAAAGLASTDSLQSVEADGEWNWIDQDSLESSQWQTQLQHSLMAAQPVDVSHSSTGGRKLQQSTNAMLQSVLDAVSNLQDSQAALQQQVQALQTAVADTAAAAQDSALQAVILTGQTQIESGQAAIQDLLSQVLGKQTAAAAASAAQIQALANLQSLQQQQLAAQAQLEQSAKDQTDGIAVALQQALLSASQALELYRRVRLQTLVATKAALLASVPCTVNTLIEYGFSVDQYPDVPINTSRERYIGTSNRVIAGLLLFNQRDLRSACSNARFAAIGGGCQKGLDTTPYGVDPVFKLGTSLYNPDFDSLDGVTSFYNCSNLLQQTYNVTVEASPGVTPQIVNPPPYCAELYNPRNLPFGFHASTLKQFGDGFPVLFDINLDTDNALKWLAFLQEGLYLDARTQRLLAQVVTYNAELRLFSSTVVSFDFVKGGSVQVTQKIQTLRVELYATGLDAFRLVLELALTLCIAVMAYTECRGIYRVSRLTGNPLSYFTNGWRTMDFASTVFLVACVVMWWLLVWRDALTFTISLRFNVYADLGANAALLTLADGGAGLHDMHAAFSRLQGLSDKLSWYAAMTGINLLMLIARLLQLLDFQPRLGVVTRSLAHAGPDLLHFGLVFGLVFIGYAMLAHLIFGNSIAGFSTFGASVNTCFALLLGDTSVNSDLLGLDGLQGVAGAAFFWTYEVLVFLVLLNFLLAIIVDAFSQVKERTTDTTGLHTELAQMLGHAYYSVASRFSHDRVTDMELSKLLHWWHDSERSAADINGDGMVDEDEALLQDKAKTKTLRVGGKVVAEEELKTILQAYVLEEEQDGDLEASRMQPGGAARVLGSLGLKWHHQPGTTLSQKPIRTPLPDFGKVAHYLLLRFGEEQPDGQQSAHDSRCCSGQLDCAAGKALSARMAAAAPQSPRQHNSNFLISAHHGADVSSTSAAAAAADSLPSSSTAAAANCGGAHDSPPSNGWGLANTMLCESERHGAADAAVSLLRVQGMLSEAQKRVLDSQQQVAAQQAAVLHVVTNIAAEAHAGPDACWPEPAEYRGSLPGSPATSFRQRTVARSDSGRAPGQLPPGRPGGSLRGPRLLLGESSQEER